MKKVIVRHAVNGKKAETMAKLNSDGQKALDKHRNIQKENTK